MAPLDEERMSAADAGREGLVLESAEEDDVSPDRIDAGCTKFPSDDDDGQGERRKRKRNR